MKLSTKPDVVETTVAAPELLDPLTGEVLDRADRDGLITAFERVAQKDRELFTFKRDLALALVALTDGKAKTRRLRGQTRCVKIEMPDDHVDQSKLITAWMTYPKFRDEYFRIERVGLKKIEWKKAAETSGEKDFEMFKTMVKASIGPPTGMPRVTVEK